MEDGYRDPASHDRAGDQHGRITQIAERTAENTWLKLAGRISMTVVMAMGIYIWTAQDKRIDEQAETLKAQSTQFPAALEKQSTQFSEALRDQSGQFTRALEKQSDQMAASLKEQSIAITQILVNQGQGMTERDEQSKRIARIEESIQRIWQRFLSAPVH